MSLRLSKGDCPGREIGILPTRIHPRLRARENNVLHYPKIYLHIYKIESLFVCMFLIQIYTPSQIGTKFGT